MLCELWNSWNIQDRGVSRIKLLPKWLSNALSKEAEAGNIQTEICEYFKFHFAPLNKALAADVGVVTCVTCGRRQTRNTRDFS